MGPFTIRVVSRPCSWHAPPVLVRRAKNRLYHWALRVTLKRRWSSSSAPAWMSLGSNFSHGSHEDHWQSHRHGPCGCGGVRQACGYPAGPLRPQDPSRSLPRQHLRGDSTGATVRADRGERGQPCRDARRDPDPLRGARLRSAAGRRRPDRRRPRRHHRDQGRRGPRPAPASRRADAARSRRRPPARAARAHLAADREGQGRPQLRPSHGVDYVALSFVRNADEVRLVRDICEAWGRPTPIVSKIETPGAIDNLEAIILASDGVMVARGDLGVEFNPERVPIIQREILGLARVHQKPVIVATEMLQSMVTRDAPDARRGERRGDGRLRRHRRGHALAGDRDRRAPAARRADDGPHRDARPSRARSIVTSRASSPGSAPTSPRRPRAPPATSRRTSARS